MSNRSSTKGVWPWRKDSSSPTNPEELLKELQENMKSLSKNTELGVSLSERIQDTIEQAVETNAEFRDSTVEELNQLSSIVSNMRHTISDISKAKEMGSYIIDHVRHDLAILVNGFSQLSETFSQLSETIEGNIEDGRRLTNQAEEWAQLEKRLQAEHAAIGEIIVQLTAEHISGYYESARQRHTKRRQRLFVFLLLVISLAVYGLIRQPELLLPTLLSTDGELYELFGYTLSRLGIISLVFVLILYIRESLRRTEQKEGEYEDKALRIRTGIVGEGLNVNDEVMKMIRDEVSSPSIERTDDANHTITSS